MVEMGTMTVEAVEAVGQIQRISQVPTVLDVCAHTTGMGFVAIARVTEDRWITCAVRDELDFGLEPGGELAVGTTICNEVRACSKTIVIDDVDRDPLFRNHPTPRQYGFKSYISEPIILPDGSFFGTLCAIDPKPNLLDTPKVRGMFRLFADLVAAQLLSEDELAATRARLAGEQETARLREEFIAVVGHDLRNPVAALDAGLRVLGRRDLPDDARAILGEMGGVVRRIDGIIANLLDFARGRLGDGIEAELQPDVDVAAIIDAALGEARAVADRPIEARIGRLAPVRCNPQRIGQLVSNLIGNAVTHGAQGAPIIVSADTDGNRLRLAVSNAGAPIPAAILPVLFQPFTRSATGSHRDGLGLGLYISAQIARAHGGTLSVHSDESATVFTFEMPQ